MNKGFHLKDLNIIYKYDYVINYNLYNFVKNVLL